MQGSRTASRSGLLCPSTVRGRPTRRSSMTDNPAGGPAIPPCPMHSPPVIFGRFVALREERGGSGVVLTGAAPESWGGGSLP